MNIKRLVNENKWMILSFVAAVVVYMVMILITIPAIRNSMNGIEIFDLRPMGYSVNEGFEILSALTKETIQYYKYVQLPLDLIYPFALSMFCFLALSKLTSKMGKLKVVKWSAFLVMTFDYLENIGIYYLLSNTVKPWMIQVTSFFSVSKSLSTIVVMTILCILIILSIRNKYFKKANEHV